MTTPRLADALANSHVVHDRATLEAAIERIAGDIRAAYAEGAQQAGTSGMQAVSAAVVNTARSSLARFQARAQQWATGHPADAGGMESSNTANAPAWARRLQRRQHLSHGISTAAHVVRSADRGGSGANPSLRDPSNS